MRFKLIAIGVGVIVVLALVLYIFVQLGPTSTTTTLGTEGGAVYKEQIANTCIEHLPGGGVSWSGSC